ncbi:ATPase [Stakelama sp. CBK3Z-3]|uniref:ATP synthase subunit b n=1 Tax=Stakelama flava TaxID=2860338 RepID=A0ABS6XNQ8_9SPHN|nr:ATPase [Stakelama flava]
MPQMVWLVVAFAILYFVIVQTTLPRLGRTIDAREKKVMGDLTSAERAKAEADHMQAEYEAGVATAQDKARARVAEARAAAAREIEANNAETNRMLHSKVETAEAALAERRAKAIGEIEAVAAEAAGDIVEKLTGSRPDPAETQAAARAALA